MPVDRFYTDQELSLNAIVEISDKEFHHMTRVLRKEVGDPLELVNGLGYLAQCRIDSIAKRSCSVLIEDIAHFSEPKTEIILAQAFTRPQKLDDIIEKGTEIGVSQFWLFPGKLSEKKALTENQMSRLNHITTSALKQSGRLWLPEIHLKAPLVKWTPPDCPFYFGDVSPEAPKLPTLLNPSSRVLFCVGPESGFDQGEIEQLRLLGGCGVSLNANTLRTETAAIVAVGILAALAEFS